MDYKVIKINFEEFSAAQAALLLQWNNYTMKLTIIIDNR